ncbi:MAG: hypothetical protein GC190_12070 [Alphaproteobacteria bacterium]|nr:hypothetical protein [Alphaproteobacteria bacterium]
MRPTWKLVLFVVLLTAGSAPGVARADRDAEQFVGGLLHQASAVLRDGTGGEAARSARLHQLVMQNLDARQTALFALGPYRRNLDPRVVEDYVAAFTDYITALYEARLRTFRSFDFKIVASMDKGPADTTVVTQASPPPEFRGRAPVYIWLRLSRAGGVYKITDVQIAGMWVSLYQREEFARQLSANNADLRALTSYLAYQAAQIKAGHAQV